MGVTVFAIIGDGLNIDDIKKDLREENYPHTFTFDSYYSEPIDPVLVCVDEVWYFGNCENNASYIRAKELGLDIWQMG